MAHNRFPIREIWRVPLSFRINKVAIPILLRAVRRNSILPNMDWKYTVHQIRPYRHNLCLRVDVNDYALIFITHDSGRTVLVGWGLTHRGTGAICQVLQYFDTQYTGFLSGHAMIVKWVDMNGDTEVDLEDQITVVEAWP